MIKVSDFIMKYLADYGVKHVFMITGGGAMHLNDSIAKEKRITPIFNHHEQACAIAAEAYARITGKLAVVNVTTGPGGLNALNGVFGAYTDSIPMLILSGQVKNQTCLRHHNLQGKLRQLGDQEVDITSVTEPITKLSLHISDPQYIKYDLEKAINYATTQRQGPVWLDIPIDVQSSMVDETKLIPWIEPKGLSDIGFVPLMDITFTKLVSETMPILIQKLTEAKSPVIMLGQGLRLSRTIDQAIAFADKLNIPIVTSWSGVDLIPTDHRLFCGRPGTIGDRAGNFTVQNADFILILGSRLNIRQVSYNWENFAKNAFKCVVDIDKNELEKPLVKADLAIASDLKIFFHELQKCEKIKPKSIIWLNWCKERYYRYPVSKSNKYGVINPYTFLQTLYNHLDGNCIVVCGNGSASVIGFQTAIVKQGQRYIANSGCASMGYDLPAAIGAAIADPKKQIICIAGDGSIMMNLQELQTIKHYNLNIKIFVVDNNGYLSIRTTQNNFFKGNYIGESPESGVSLPDFVKVAESFGIKGYNCNPYNYSDYISFLLQKHEPLLCTVKVDTEQLFEPKLSSRVLPDGKMQSSSLEDMFPFLDEEEMKSNIFQENN